MVAIVVVNNRVITGSSAVMGIFFFSFKTRDSSNVAVG